MKLRPLTPLLAALALWIAVPSFALFVGCLAAAYLHGRVNAVALFVYGAAWALAAALLIPVRKRKGGATRS